MNFTQHYTKNSQILFLTAALGDLCVSDYKGQNELSLNEGHSSPGVHCHLHPPSPTYGLDVMLEFFYIVE